MREQKIVVNNTRRSSQNPIDITHKLQSQSFVKTPQKIELLDASFDLEYDTFGDSNNKFSIVRNGITHNLSIVFSSVYENVESLEIHLNAILQTEIGQFDPGGGNINRISVNIATVGTVNTRVYDSFYRGLRYIFTANDAVPFQIDFRNEKSCGVLFGFGQVLTSLATTHTSTFRGAHFPTMRNIYRGYVGTGASIHSINNVMQIFNSSGASIGIFFISGSSATFTDINEFAKSIQSFLNNYTGSFASANFFVDYDLSTQKFTIENIAPSPSIFGIGFNFNFYGSPHKILGFERQNYKGKTKYIGKKVNFIPNMVPEKVLYVCSDLVGSSASANTFDLNPTFEENHNILFSIPLSPKNDNLTVYTEQRGRQIVDISNSVLADKFRKRLLDDLSIRFYLRTSSGRHITESSKWVLRLMIHS